MYQEFISSMSELLPHEISKVYIRYYLGGNDNDKINIVIQASKKYLDTMSLKNLISDIEEINGDGISIKDALINKKETDSGTSYVIDIVATGGFKESTRSMAIAAFNRFSDFAYECQGMECRSFIADSVRWKGNPILKIWDDSEAINAAVRANQILVKDADPGLIEFLLREDRIEIILA